MADVKESNFIKWPVQGAMALGKINNQTDKEYFVETPTGQLVSVIKTSAVEITKDEFNTALKSMISTLSTQVLSTAEEICIKIEDKEEELDTEEAKCQDSPKEENTMLDTQKANETQAALDAVKAEVENLRKANESLAAQLKASEEANAKVKSESEAKVRDMEKTCAETEAKYKEAEAKVQEMQKASITQARIAEFTKLNALDIIADTTDQAIAALRDMDEKTYSSVLNVAKKAVDKVINATITALPKTTDQTVTSLPKTTDQTVTSLPKLTQAEEVKIESDQALENATKENDSSLATAGSNKDNSKSILEKWATNSFRSGKKVNKVK